MQPHEFHDLDRLRERAGQGDSAACIRLADELLARAPYHGPRWESDSKWQAIWSSEMLSNLHATESYERFMYEAWRTNERCVLTGRLNRERREEELGRDTPGRDEMLAEAAHALERAAYAGDPEAMWRLGYRHWLGQGVPADWKAAEYWWQRAAEHGHGWSRKLVYHLLQLPDDE